MITGHGCKQGLRYGQHMKQLAIKLWTLEDLLSHNFIISLTGHVQGTDSLTVERIHITTLNK